MLSVKPFLALLAGMVSIQFGAVAAKHLFPIFGAPGTTAIRLGLSALILLPILRPWRATLTRANLPMLLAYGGTLGVMNLLFYTAIQRIPLGIAVALEFTGPLTLAVALSRRWTDLAWTVLAVAGLLCLLPLGEARHALDTSGIFAALGAGACWAAYTVFGQRAGAEHGITTTALGIVIGAIIIVPFGVAHMPPAAFHIALLPSMFAVAIFSGALPFSLEMIALTGLSTRVYGSLTSVEPAIGALLGLIFLGESLTLLQALGVVIIMAASLGTAATAQPVLPAG